MQLCAIVVSIYDHNCGYLEPVLRLLQACVKEWQIQIAGIFVIHLCEENEHPFLLCEFLPTKQDTATSYKSFGATGLYDCRCWM